MDYDKIKYAVYEVYEECSVHQLPFDCLEVIDSMRYPCIRYSALSAEQNAACLQLSEDACILGNEIYYNDKKAKRRIRFSLMHELGHLVLDTQDEAEANNFASNILAPSMAVYYSGLKNVRELSNIFDISLECAKYAYEACEKWFYSARQYGMTDIDKKMYNHFYNEEANRFVFKKTRCSYCDAVIYNSNKPLCMSCDKPQKGPLLCDSQRMDFVLGECNWLYGGL